MLGYHFLWSLSLLPILSLAAVLPKGTRGTSSLAKRSTQALYLTNCIRIETGTINDYSASYGAWYADINQSQNGQWPDSLSNEMRDWGHGDGHVTWEGGSVLIIFGDSGTRIDTYIYNGANGYSVGDYAGGASRESDGAWFDCFKDSSRTVFTYQPYQAPDHSNYSLQCSAEYYCML